MAEGKSGLQDLIGRAIADPDFRAALIADPEKAATDAGYSLTMEELDSLRQVDLLAAAEGLGERLSKCPAMPCKL